jgi:hypothetical protein
MDDALIRQLSAWPNFKSGFSALYRSPYFANHCPRCQTLQEDLFLHDEPGDPFFAVPEGPPDPCQLKRLEGPIRLSGNCHFAV